MKPVVQSKTTQNVAISTGTIVGLLIMLRQMFPALQDFIPEGTETAIETVVLVVLVPLFSRLIAKGRGQA